MESFRAIAKKRRVPAMGGATIELGGAIELGDVHNRHWRWRAGLHPSAAVARAFRGDNKRPRLMKIRQGRWRRARGQSEEMGPAARNIRLGSHFVARIHKKTTTVDKQGPLHAAGEL